VPIVRILTKGGVNGQLNDVDDVCMYKSVTCIQKKKFHGS
jgi:hypothetical protein